jgi:phage regulator Rha-like protein
MEEIVKLKQVEEKIITLRGQRVILDSDVAELYGVETRDINKAVKNNPDKFPKGYVFEIDNKEFAELRRKISTANMTKTRVLPKAFSERGLYMLATILKGSRATHTTLAIVETFAKIRELSRTVAELSAAGDEFAQKTLMQKGGDIIADLLGDDLQVTDTETTFEINFALMKFKHTVRQKKKSD